MKKNLVRKVLMIGICSSVALTSTVGFTASSMDTALEAVAENETETDSEEDVAEETEDVAEETEDVAEETEDVVEEAAEDAGVSTEKIIYVSYIDESGAPIEGAEIEQVKVPWQKKLKTWLKRLLKMQE